MRSPLERDFRPAYISDKTMKKMHGPKDCKRIKYFYEEKPCKLAYNENDIRCFDFHFTFHQSDQVTQSKQLTFTMIGLKSSRNGVLIFISLILLI